MVSQVGHLAFDIDRSLLLCCWAIFMVWNRLLKKRNHTMITDQNGNTFKKPPRAGYLHVIFNLQTSGIALKLKLDSST